MSNFVPTNSIDPTITNEKNSWAQYGITDKNGCIRTIVDQYNNSIRFVHFDELDPATQQMIKNQYASSNSQLFTNVGASDYADAGASNWLAQGKSSPSYVPASSLGFGVSPTTYEPLSVQEFDQKNKNFTDSSNNQAKSKGIDIDIGKVDGAKFGTAKNSDKIEITRKYDLSRFGLPITREGDIDGNALQRYDQLEYGVAPKFENLQSLFMPPVRLIGVNKPRDLVTFTVTPSFSISGTANYDSYELSHSPVDIYTYRGSAAKEITISGTLVSRNTYEASINQQRLNILEAWTKPYFGSRTAKSMYGNYLGAPPSVLKFYAYGQRLYNGLPVVLVSYNAEWRNDCAIVYTEKGQPFPTIMPISVTIRESWSPDQVGNFNIEDLFAGNIVKAYTGKFKI